MEGNGYNTRDTLKLVGTETYYYVSYSRPKNRYMEITRVLPETD